MTTFLMSALPAFAIACALTGLLVRAGGRLGILDHPNERSLHDSPRPRTGGLAIWAGSLAATVISLGPAGMGMTLGWIAAAALLVGAVSLADDRSEVSAAVRLSVHLVAAGLLLAGGLGLKSIGLPGVEFAFGTAVSVVATAVLVVWMINLYNFMDGMDGLAGGMAVFGFGTLGLLGMFEGDAAFAAVCWAIAAASAGFVVWNVPPARIFMGDNGASVLGVMVAAMSLWGAGAGIMPFWIALLVFSPFIVDASLTLLHRMFRGERIWEPHRGHYYQRLVRAGWGHRRVMLGEYGLMLSCCIAALVAARATPDIQWLAIALVALLHAGAVVGVRRLEMRAAALHAPGG